MTCRTWCFGRGGAEVRGDGWKMVATVMAIY